MESADSVAKESKEVMRTMEGGAPLPPLEFSLKLLVRHFTPASRESAENAE